MAETQFDKILTASDYTIRDLAGKSSMWFRQEVAKIRKHPINTKSFIVADSADVTKKLEVGRMYLFRYAPKYMDTLPIWDEYPLVLPFRSTDNGFIAINFHYLPYRQRAWVLDKLMRTSGSETQRLRVSWQILNNLSRVDVGAFATHRYIMANITTPLRLIRSDDYAKAILLPIAKMHGPQSRSIAKIVGGWF